MEHHKTYISLSVALNNTGGFSVDLLSASLSLFQPLFCLQPNFQKIKPESYHSPTLKSSVTSSCSTATRFIPCLPPALAGPPLAPRWPPAPSLLIVPLLGTLFYQLQLWPPFIHSSSQMTSLPIKDFLIPSSHPCEFHVCP